MTNNDGFKSQQSSVQLNVREIVRKTQPSPRSSLRKWERELFDVSSSSPDVLERWLYRKGFRRNFLGGNPLNSDVQMFKPLGKRRWHLRLYYYPDIIVVVSEIDTMDPFHKIDSVEEIVFYVAGHLLLDSVLKEPTKKYIRLTRNLSRENGMSFLDILRGR